MKFKTIAHFDEKFTKSLEDDWSTMRNQIMDTEFRGFQQSQLQQQKELALTPSLSSSSWLALGAPSVLDSKSIKYSTVVKSLNASRKKGEKFPLVSAFWDAVYSTDDKDTVSLS
jgi:hypothetical protein